MSIGDPVLTLTLGWGYMTGAECPCAVCLAGVLAEWGGSFVGPTVVPISVRVVITFYLKVVEGL